MEMFDDEESNTYRANFNVDSSLQNQPLQKILNAGPTIKKSTYY